MLRTIEESYAYSDEKKNLDERIRQAGVNTYKQARNGAELYPTYEAFENEEHRRKEIALRKYGRDNYLYAYKSVESYWYYLGKLFSDLDKIAKWLGEVVTYKPHREEIRSALKCLDQRFEDFVNESWYNVEEYENINAEQLEAIKTGGYAVHCEFCIREFKKFINVMCRIIRENEVDHFYF